MNSITITGAPLVGNGGAGTVSTYPSSAGVNSTTIGQVPYDNRPSIEGIIDRYALNEFIVEHRVQEQELLKLKEQNVDYADTIKENMAKNLSRDVIKKVTFTKKLEHDTFVHSFRGRCWVFTKEELTNMIQEIKNGI
jgi:hypothetical protein